MKIEAYVFDIDDTLLATTTANRTARRRCLDFFLQSAGFAVDGDIVETERRLYKVFGWGKLGDLWRSLAIELGADPPPHHRLEEAAELFDTVFFENLSTLPTVTHTLAALREGGVQIAVISDGDERLQQRKLRHTGLDHLFESDKVLISIQNDYYGAKPSTANFRTMEKRLGLLPHEMLYVGDKPWDIAAANAAGWTSVRTLQAGGDGANNWPLPALKVQTPDIVINTLSELLDIK
ncbi:MAG TPA: HAD family hydrolase [Acidobacteriota bacterium]|nr:HAD family hydrolase [Acidobacteriota bacterium]